MTGLTATSRLVTAQREDLVATHVGQTAPRTNDVIDEARGGTLLIDEVYRLVPVDSTRDFGHEALESLMSVMEGEPNTTTDRPAIILAGYPECMTQVLNANAGLARRITHRFDFPNYAEEELAEILFVMAKKDDYTLSSDCTLGRVAEAIRSAVPGPTLHQHNAGFSSRLYQTAKQKNNIRLVENIMHDNMTPTPAELSCIQFCDIINALPSVVPSL